MRDIFLIICLLSVPCITLADNEVEVLSCEKSKKHILTKAYPSLQNISVKKTEYLIKRNLDYRQLKTRLELEKQKGEIDRSEQYRKSQEFLYETLKRRLEYDIEFGYECLKVTGKNKGIDEKLKHKPKLNNPTTNKLKNTNTSVEFDANEGPSTRGKLEVVNYYKILTGSNIMVFNPVRTQNIENLSTIRETKRGLTNELAAIPSDCYSEQCTSKRNRIYDEIEKNQEDFKKIDNERKRIAVLNTHQVLPLYSMYAAIEKSCDREPRYKLFKDYALKLVQKQFKQKYITTEDVDKKNKLINRSYLQTKQDIESGKFKVDCTWEILDKHYSYANDRYKRLK